jgi:hypothetical protein
MSSFLAAEASASVLDGLAKIAAEYISDSSSHNAKKSLPRS